MPDARRSAAPSDPAFRSWLESANDPATDFPPHSLPLCYFLHGDRDDPDAEPSIGLAVGDRVVDLSLLFDSWEDLGLTIEAPADFDEEEALAFTDQVYDAFAGADVYAALSTGPDVLRQIRAQVAEALRAGNEKDPAALLLKKRGLLPMVDVSFEVPCPIGDYTDFYASVHHATNVGSMFRPDNPLLPNYKWVPIGYHGRSSSVMISGSPVVRPLGQTMADDAAPGSAPAFGPSRRLDYELELGFYVHTGTAPGEAIPLREAESRILGVCLVNDWSARDLQKWEYQPLGPFLAKNFATSVSPFVVPLEALSAFRCPAMERPSGDPRPLPYLSDEGNERRGGLNITLEASIRSRQMRERGLAPTLVSRGSFRHMYWTIAQLLTHHASNGCPMRPGDLLASGTVSGPDTASRGCLLEATWQGVGPDGKPLPRKPVALSSGETRLFLEDGDEVILKGYCEAEGARRVGLGECRGVVEPARG